MSLQGIYGGLIPSGSTNFILDHVNVPADEIVGNDTQRVKKLRRKLHPEQLALLQEDKYQFAF